LKIRSADIEQVSFTFRNDLSMEHLITFDIEARESPVNNTEKGSKAGTETAETEKRG
jgi:hypothetical protein